MARRISSCAVYLIPERFVEKVRDRLLRSIEHPQGLPQCSCQFLGGNEQTIGEIDGIFVRESIFVWLQPSNHKTHFGDLDGISPLSCCVTIRADVVQLRDRSSREPPSWTFLTRGKLHRNRKASTLRATTH
jgi:hypothetical protein